jgi:hypothetical protein
VKEVGRRVLGTGQLHFLTLYTVATPSKIHIVCCPTSVFWTLWLVLSHRYCTFTVHILLWLCHPVKQVADFAISPGDEQPGASSGLSWVRGSVSRVLTVVFLPVYKYKALSTLGYPS